MCSLFAWLDSWGASMPWSPFCPVELTAAPLCWAASGASVGPARGDPGARRVTLWGRDLRNQSRERNKAEIKIGSQRGSQTSPQVTACGQTEWDPADIFSRVNVDSVTEGF